MEDWNIEDGQLLRGYVERRSEKDFSDEEQQRQNRIEAVKGLLTPEQLEAYRQPRPVRGYH